MDINRKMERKQLINEIRTSDKIKVRLRKIEQVQLRKIYNTYNG